MTPLTHRWVFTFVVYQAEHVRIKSHVNL